MKVFIWGSCVSRDCFNYPSSSSFELVAYHARCSCASAMSPPVTLKGINLNAVKSSFKRRCIVDDFQKGLLRDLKALDFDILLIDFIDERFPLKIDAEGRAVTVSSELQETHSVQPNDNLIHVGSEERFSLWSSAWDSFMDFCVRHGIKDKIIVNCVYWAKTLDNGEAIPNFTSSYIAKNNIFLERIYARVAKDLPQSQYICYPKEFSVANSSHQWGISPFHYIDYLYGYTISHLSRLYSISYPGMAEKNMSSPLRIKLKEEKDAIVSNNINNEFTESQNINFLSEGFVPSFEPYNDICFIFCKKIELSTEINKLCKLLSINVFCKKNIFCIANVKNDYNLLSGYGNIGEYSFYGKVEKEYRIKDVESGIGNFTFFKLKGKSLFACHDYFGLGSIYTYQDNNFIIVSNRAHLVAIFSSLSKERKINIANIKSIILCSHHFRQDAWCDETPIQNLERLPSNKSIFVHNDKIHFINKKIEIIEDTYDNLIVRAKKNIYNNYKSIINKIPEKNIIFDLSGGKDSRACIAPFIKENLTIHTDDVKGSRDLNISNIIVSIYSNLSYRSKFYGNITYINQKESLSIWRSIFMGSYNRMTLVEFGNFGKTNEIIISGGCGELYRTYWNVNKPEICSSFLEWITYILENKEQLLNSFEEDKENIIEYVIKHIIDLNEYSHPEDAMSAFYRRTRFRTHFGERLFSACTGSMIIFPLLSKELFSAAQQLSSADRDAARLFFDYINSIDEKLAHIDFDGDFRYQKESRTYCVEPVKDRLKKIEKCYTEAQHNYFSSRKISFDINSKDRLLQNLTYDEFINYELALAILRITKFSVQLESFFTKLYEIYHKNIQKDIKQALCSRVFSIDDYLYPLDCIKQKVVWTTEEFEKIIYPIDGCVNENKKITITCYKYINKNNYDYALYVLKDKKIIKKYMYRDSCEFIIDPPLEINGLVLFAKNKITKQVFSKQLDINIF